ncbi:MAG: cyclase family protein [Alphaproteobacteria bacterium]|nr:cyclase family protein [Alphaproteobacteria bacterium]
MPHLRALAPACLVTCLLATSLAEPVRGAEDWYPSPYGAEDRLGALNNLSTEKTRAAAGLVREGKVYALGVITGRTTPAYPGRDFSLIMYPHGDGSGAGVGPENLVSNDDYLATWLGIGTQIDGFAHFGIGHRYYNGVPVAEVFDRGGAKLFGTHTLPPIATRGVLLDMVAHFGADPVPAGTAFNRAEIEAAASARGISIGKGDVVLFHTGWQAMAAKDPAGFIAGQPGLGLEGARYLGDLGVVAIGADTAALEVIPFEDPDRPFPVHPELLTRRGIHILENIDTRALATDGATDFLFVLGVPRFEGAVQMVINPVAIR